MKIEDIQNGLSGIYKINFPNGKYYIGLSKNIRRRINEHLKRDYKDYPHLPISKAIHKYGISDIEVLEKDIFNREELQEREIYWISFYKSNNREYGYNITPGGDGCSEGIDNSQALLTEGELLEIYNLLINSKLTYSEIGKKFSVKDYIIERINNGHTYFNERFDYPLRKKQIRRYGLENKMDSFYNRKKELNNLIYDLRNTDIPFSELMKKYKIGQTTLSLINVGKKYYNSVFSYPLRKNAKSANRRIFSQEEMDFIKKHLENNSMPMHEIAKIIKCDSKVVSNINKGTRQRNNEWNYPLRKKPMKTGPKPKSY